MSVFLRVISAESTEHHSVKKCINSDECHSGKCYYDKYGSPECHFAECYSPERQLVEYYYPERHFAECHSAESYSVEYHPANFYSAECHFVECHSAECHGSIAIRWHKFRMLHFKNRLAYQSTRKDLTHIYEIRI